MDSAIDKIQKYHDIIKEHPFRMDFDQKFAGDYNYLMYQLSVAWSRYIWDTPKASEYEKQKFRQFGEWIHDYRQTLGYNANYFPTYMFNYYEQMLQITHKFLDTGDIDVFYNPETIHEMGTGNKKRASVKYQFMTSEICGVDSPILPCYLPVNYKYNIDQSEIINYFNTYWYYKQLPEDERNSIIEYWYKNTLPVLEWINNNCAESSFVLPLYKSIRISDSKLKILKEK